MSVNRVRASMIGLLVGAAVLSVIANKAKAQWLGWLSFVLFLGAVFLYVDWRRRLAAQRRAASVLDSEAETDETRTSADE